MKVLSSNSKPHPTLDGLEKAMEPLELFSHLSLEEFLPENSQKQCNSICNLEGGVKTSCVLLTYSTGNNKGNFHFIWKSAGTEEVVIEKSQAIIEAVRKLIPTFHTRTMRK